MPIIALLKGQRQMCDIIGKEMRLGDESHSTYISGTLISGDDGLDINFFLILLQNQLGWLVELEGRVMVGYGLSDGLTIELEMNFGLEVDLHLE